MNRRHFILTTTAAATAFTVPARAAAKKETLNIFCWSEYIPQSIVDGFAKANNVKVNVENYASNEEMMAKLQAGTAKYDIIQPSEYIIEELVKDGKLEAIDLANIPNFKNLDPKYTHLAHDPENKYSVTWMAGSVGIVINRAKVKDEIKTYNDVFQDKFKKRIVVLDDHRELVAWALASLGIGINDVTKETLEKAKGVLAKWLPLVKLYDSDSPKTALLNGDCDLGIVWSGEGAKILQEMKKSKKRKLEFEYVLPSDGAHLFIDSLAIPKGAKNKAVAQKFMNYVLEPKVSVAVWTDFPYTMVNAEGKKLLKPDQLANVASFPPGEPKLDIFKMIPKDMAAAIDKLVTDLKNK
jgi:spermidine/putrescine transport system substrate-binding protein